jgi:hypothetical protein
MEVLMGKSSINGPFSMAMLNNQRVNPFLSMEIIKRDSHQWISKGSHLLPSVPR